jgi:uncharacterized membrane protein
VSDPERADVTHIGTQPPPAGDEPGVTQAPPPAFGRRELRVVLGFVCGAALGLAMLELGFWRTLVVSCCGVLGVWVALRGEDLMAFFRGH